MGEIKFRIYDKKGRKMLPFDYLVKFALLGLIFTKEIQYKVMQYTGLKDKNGVEIYEGNVVFHEEGEFSYSGVVKKDKYYFYIDGVNDSYSFDDVADTSTGQADLEVIGNIYENPELLEVQNG